MAPSGEFAIPQVSLDRLRAMPLGQSAEDILDALQHGSFSLTRIRKCNHNSIADRNESEDNRARGEEIDRSLRS